MTFVILAALLSHNGGVFVVFQNPTNTIWPHLFWFLGLMHLLCSIRVLDVRYLCFRVFFLSGLYGWRSFYAALACTLEES